MRNTQLQNAVKCSEIMLKNAEAGNWDKVFDIEAQRSDLLERLFSGSKQENSVEDIDDKIRKIIDINKKLEAITLEARDNTRNDIASISKGRHAINLYEQNTF